MKRGASIYFILIALVLAALVAIILLLSPDAAPETPAVILSPPPAADSSAAPPSDAPDSRVIEVAPDTVQAVIATLSRADSYSRTLTTQNFWNGGSSGTEIDVWVRGENVRLSIRESARKNVVKNVLIRGGEEWIWYSDGGGVWHGSARAGDADAYQTLLTYEDVLTIEQSAIRDAGYTDFNGETCIFVRYAGGTLGYESLCYISVDTGLMMGTETYDGDILVYTMRSSDPDISTPDEEIFTEP